MPRPAPAETSGDSLDNHKALIYDLYVKRDLSLGEVAAHLKRDFQLEATGRQYKTRLQKWGMDKKKVSRPVYLAMWRIVQHYGSEVKMIVPTNDGHHSKTCTAEAISKEVRRGNSQDNDDQDLDEAFRTLARVGITILNSSNVVIAYPGYHQLSQAHTHSHKSLDHSSSRHVLSYRNDEEDNTSTVPGIVDRDADSTAVDKLHGRLLNYPNHIPEYRQATVRQTWRVPYPLALEAELFSIVALKVPVTFTTPRDWLVFRLARSTMTDTTTTNEMRLLYMIAPELEIAINYSQSDSADVSAWEENFQIQLDSLFNTAPDGGMYLQAVICAGYYISQTLAGHDILDAVDHPDRRKAQASFSKILGHDTGYTLCFILTVVTVLGSHDKPTLLMEFLQDCSNATQSSVARNNSSLTVSIHHALVMATAEHNNETLPGVANRDENLRNSIQAMQRDLTALCLGVDEQGEQNTLSFVLLQIQLAWTHFELKEPDTCLEVLLKILPSAEKLLGFRHVVTMNCLRMVAGAYDCKSDGKCMNYLALALSRLAPTPNILQPLRYRLYSVIADIFESRKDLIRAAELLRVIWSFRKARFGLNARQTWHAIYAYQKILEKLGRFDKAQELLTMNYDQFNATTNHARTVM